MKCFILIDVFLMFSLFLFIKSSNRFLRVIKYDLIRSSRKLFFVESIFFMCLKRDKFSSQISFEKIYKI